MLTAKQTLKAIKIAKQTRTGAENASDIVLTAHLCFCISCFNSKLEKRN
jgi:hypothetical protein